MLGKFFAGVAALAMAAQADAETYAIQAGHLIVDAAQAERGNSTVIVENGRISRIESGFTAPNGATVVDQRSRTVMPGLTDVHVHLTQNSGEPWYIGFTKKYFESRGIKVRIEFSQNSNSSIASGCNSTEKLLYCCAYKV